MNKDFRSEIRSITVARGVSHLLHFTQTANLAGIERHGILPRREIARLDYPVYGSDEYRLDACNDAVSVSITRINESMFASKRIKSEHSNWVVLVLSPEILWTHECQFCWCNAARKEIQNHRGFRGGPWALEKMFAGSAELRRDLAPNCPTDPEAEVQVLDAIGPQYILEVLGY